MCCGACFSLHSHCRISRCHHQEGTFILRFLRYLNIYFCNHRLAVSQLRWSLMLSSAAVVLPLLVCTDYTSEFTHPKLLRAQILNVFICWSLLTLRSCCSNLLCLSHATLLCSDRSRLFRAVDEQSWHVSFYCFLCFAVVM
jgi:hypothetical protein